MSFETELRDTIETAATGLDLPAGDLDRVTGRGRRRRAVHRALKAVGGLAVVLGLVASGMVLLDAPLPVDIVDRPTPGVSSPLPDEPSPPKPPVYEPVPCPPNASCVGTSFLLDGVRYHIRGACAPVRGDSVGPTLEVRAEPPSADVPALRRLAGYPIEHGVVIEAGCADAALATPADEVTSERRALVRAQMRCEVLAEPPASDRCDTGGDARWRAGPAWYDYAYAPFPSYVDAVDAMLASGDDGPRWRTDPLQVAERRYGDESVCRDGGEPCDVQLAVTDQTSTTARIVGTVHPFPDVVWDLQLTVERLGDAAWWTTRMTIQPRGAGATLDPCPTGTSGPEGDPEPAEPGDACDSGGPTQTSDEPRYGGPSPAAD